MGLNTVRSSFIGAYKSGYYVFPDTMASNTTIPNEAQMYAHPLFIPKSVVIDRIGVRISVVGSAGAVVRLGIYNTIDGYPATLLLDAGTVVGTGTGSITATISQSLSAGVYFLAAAVQGGATTRPTMGTTSNTISNRFIMDPNFNEFAGSGYYQTGVTGAFPSPMVPIGRANAIEVFVRYV